MSENSNSAEGAVTARSLMKTDFRTIGAELPVQEALDLLTGEGEGRAASPAPLVVVHEDGSFAGLLTPMALFKVLLRKMRLDDLERLSEAELFDAMRDQLDVSVAETMVREVPRAYADDRLLTLMAINAERRLEFTPVIEEDRVIGIIYVTDIFQAAASLAITHETAGIQLDSEKDSEPELRH